MTIAHPPAVSAFARYLGRLIDGPNRVVVVSDPAQDLQVGQGRDVGVVVGERSARSLRRLGRPSGLEVRFAATPDPATASAQDPVVVTLLDRWDPSAVPPAPAGFDVLAILTTFNEEEIIDQTVRRLVDGGIRVHVVDNWSTDTTPAHLEHLVAEHGGRVTTERFPTRDPSGYFELALLLERITELADATDADWVIHHDTDEVREGPWPGVGLRDALWAVQWWGYNCVDHTIVNFRPLDNGYRPGADLVASFPWFEFGDAAGHFTQLKTWKPPPGGVTMTAGGHEVLFAGRRVFPYKFVTRHYPIRSQEHGERKILRERQARWSPQERARGWHIHYDHYGPGSSFLWDRAHLAHSDQLQSGLLLQRLSGVCLPGNPWPGEGLKPD